MCDSPVYILLAADQEDFALIANLINQIRGRHYRLDRAETYDAVLKSLNSKQHHVYLLSSQLKQHSAFGLLHESVFQSYESQLILLSRTSKEQAACTAAGAICFTQADLTAASIDQLIQLVLQQTQFTQSLGHTLQQNTQLKHQLDLVQQTEERLKLAFVNPNEGFWNWNLETNEIFFSEQPQVLLEHKLGNIAAQHTVDEWFEQIHPEDLYWIKREVKFRVDGSSCYFENEYRLLHQENSYHWMLMRGQIVRNDLGKATHIVGIQVNIDNLKHPEKSLFHEALYDALTGLPNRFSLIERLRYASEKAIHNQDYRFAVLFIDLDRFKMINDSLGHTIGDQLLYEISQRLTKYLQLNDTIARLGGDEFVILLEDIKTQDSPVFIARQILQELATPFNLAGCEIFISASIGITLSTLGLAHPEDLLRDADLAMCRAKAQGRGRYEIFHPRMHTSAIAMLHMESDLRRALDRQELKLHYQPIFSLRSNRLVGFEALIRWQHPRQGLVSPLKFIPIAEETGLITPIGAWVLQEACRQMRQWQQAFPQWKNLRVNVNLSSKQFNPDLVEQVQQALSQTELEAQHLKLELTESVLMSHAESAVETLTQLKQLGIHLAIDDFGTGYSSLSYLHRFPIDTLKIDRSFIKKVDVDGEQLAIVRTIMTLAWNLGMEVVAEGVETPKQLIQLRSLRCEYAQGYLFSQPCDPKAIEELLAQTPEQSRFKLLEKYKR